jgi:hypothetical protein
LGSVVAVVVVVGLGDTVLEAIVRRVVGCPVVPEWDPRFASPKPGSLSPQT